VQWIPYLSHMDLRWSNMDPRTEISMGRDSRRVPKLDPNMDPSGDPLSSTAGNGRMGDYGCWGMAP
jgi:hypothetical protein